MINYESELSDVLLENLKGIYSLEESVVFDYFYLRFLIEYNDRLEKNEDTLQKLVEFLIKELNLPCTDNSFEYKREKIVKGFAIENSLGNIVTNWSLQASLKTVTTSQGVKLTHKEYIGEEYKKLYRYGKNKAKVYKEQPSYQSYLKYNALLLLNKHYLAKPDTPSCIEGISYPEYHHFFIRTLEEIYSAHIHSSEVSVRNTNTITEQDLEDYLVKHLSLIEEGLRYIDRQVSIKDGRIDILAMDKENNFVILELKVQEDKELIWQCMYYPIAFKEKERLNNVRMITVAPKYEKHILIPLQAVKNVEIVQFQPHVELGRIISLDIKKIS